MPGTQRSREDRGNGLAIAVNEALARKLDVIVGHVTPNGPIRDAGGILSVPWLHLAGKFARICRSLQMGSQPAFEHMAANLNLCLPVETSLNTRVSTHVTRDVACLYEDYASQHVRCTCHYTVSVFTDQYRNIIRRYSRTENSASNEDAKLDASNARYPLAISRSLDCIDTCIYDIKYKIQRIDTKYDIQKRVRFGLRS